MSIFKGYTGIYALCTNAKGTLDKNGNLVCNCSVRKGIAVGINNGKIFKPYTIGGKTYITSLYSGINGNMLKKHTCNLLTNGTWGIV